MVCVLFSPKKQGLFEVLLLQEKLSVHEGVLHTRDEGGHAGHGGHDGGDGGGEFRGSTGRLKHNIWQQLGQVGEVKTGLVHT